MIEQSGHVMIHIELRPMEAGAAPQQFDFRQSEALACSSPWRRVRGMDTRMPSARCIVTRPFFRSYSAFVARRSLRSKPRARASAASMSSSVSPPPTQHSASLRAGPSSHVLRAHSSRNGFHVPARKAFNLCDQTNIAEHFRFAFFPNCATLAAVRAVALLGLLPPKSTFADLRRWA